MKTIAVCNNKGGVGKTTICFCLAGALAEAGKRVLVVDMDPQGSLTSSFLRNGKADHLNHMVSDIILDDRLAVQEVVRSTPFENIDILPANLSLVKIDSELLSERDAHYRLADKLDEVKDRYNTILLDSPPSLGLATWSVLTAADGVIIPLEAQDYSVKGTGFVHALIAKVRRRANPNLRILGYLVNRYDGRRRIEQDFGAMLRKHLGSEVFHTVLKDSVRYVEAVTLGRPITHLAPKSEQADAFRKILAEVEHAEKL